MAVLHVDFLRTSSARNILPPIHTAIDVIKCLKACLYVFLSQQIYMIAEDMQNSLAFQRNHKEIPRVECG